MVRYRVGRDRGLEGLSGRLRACEKCGARYLPSRTSHPVKCGVCESYKGDTIVTIPRIGPHIDL